LSEEKQKDFCKKS